MMSPQADTSPDSCMNFLLWENMGRIIGKKYAYLLICTTFAGGNPLKYVDEAWEYAPMFSE